MSDSYTLEQQQVYKDRLRDFLEENNFFEEYDKHCHFDDEKGFDAAVDGYLKSTYDIRHILTHTILWFDTKDGHKAQRLYQKWKAVYDTYEYSHYEEGVEL